MTSYNHSRDRYALLIRPGADADGEPARSQEYAAFLRDKERMCGPEGFVDSGQIQHQYTLKQQQRKGGAQGQGQGRGGESGGQDGAQQQDDGSSTKPSTVMELMARRKKNEKDFEKRLKAIEEHMWQHKQEERELKRAEGDVIKNQRNLRRTMRDYENNVTKEKLEEEKKLSQSLNKYTELENDNVHNKKKVSRQRAEQDASMELQHKDQGRKTQVTVVQLSRQFKTKQSELELKQKEANHISQEFENKLKQKEEEQYRLKQELAELSIALNMEAQKGRQQDYAYQRDKQKASSQRVQTDREAETKLDKQLGKGDHDIKASDSNRRRLSGSLALTRAHLSLKQREEGRKRQDTENRLRANAQEQKQLNEAALHAELELKARQSDQKVQEHNARRQARMEKSLQDRREKQESQEGHYSQRAERRSQEQQRLEHEDHLRHSQKMVSRMEQQEYALYNQVKNGEYKRQKQEQSVRRLQARLQDMRRQHAVKVKNEMTEQARSEHELELKLQREQAELAKAHAQREEGYYSLQSQRELLKSERYLLTEREREYNRLLRIGERTDSAGAS